MKPDQLKDSEIDGLLSKALQSDSDLAILPGLSDKIIRKLERRIIIHDLLLELFSKIGIAVVSVALLTGIFVWIKGSGLLTELYGSFINHWQIILSALLILFITLLIDQVGLRFYAIFKREIKFGSE